MAEHYNDWADPPEPPEGWLAYYRQLLPVIKQVHQMDLAGYRGGEQVQQDQAKDCHLVLGAWLGAYGMEGPEHAAHRQSTVSVQVYVPEYWASGPKMEGEPEPYSGEGRYFGEALAEAMRHARWRVIERLEAALEDTEPAEVSE